MTIVVSDSDLEMRSVVLVINVGPIICILYLVNCHFIIMLSSSHAGQWTLDIQAKFYPKAQTI